ncbi:MAG: hypothetical protein RLZZ245_3020 [Verrucomicrobiota bacterium]
MTLMEEQIFREAGIRNEAETKRKAQTLVERDEESKNKGCCGEMAGLYGAVGADRSVGIVKIPWDSIAALFQE